MTEEASVRDKEKKLKPNNSRPCCKNLQANFKPKFKVVQLVLIIFLLKLTQAQLLGRYEIDSNEVIDLQAGQPRLLLPEKVGDNEAIPLSYLQFDRPFDVLTTGELYVEVMAYQCNQELRERNSHHEEFYENKEGKMHSVQPYPNTDDNNDNFQGLKLNNRINLRTITID